MRFLTNLMMNVNRVVYASEEVTATPEVNDQLKTTVDNAAKTIWGTVRNVLSVVMPIVLAVVLAFGVFFSIKLGMAYAQAETTEKREEAKKRLVGAIIGFGIGIIASALMWWISGSTLFDNLFA